MERSVLRLGVRTSELPHCSTARTRYNPTKRAKLFVLCGRRRVGKTELLRAFCEGKRAIFYEADLGSAGMLLANFSHMIGEALYSNPGLVFDSLDAAFDEIA